MIEYIIYDEASNILAEKGWQGIIEKYFNDIDISIPSYELSPENKLSMPAVRTGHLAREDLLLQLAYERNLTVNNVIKKEGKISIIDFAPLDVDLMQKSCGQTDFESVLEASQLFATNKNFVNTNLVEILDYINSCYPNRNYVYILADIVSNLKISIDITTDDNLYSALAKICIHSNLSWTLGNNEKIIIIPRKYQLKNNDVLFHLSRVLSHAGYKECVKFLQRNGWLAFFEFFFGQYYADSPQVLNSLLPAEELQLPNIGSPAVFREGMSIGEFLFETMSQKGYRLKLLSENYESIGGIYFSDIAHSMLGQTNTYEINSLSQILAGFNYERDEEKTVSNIIDDIRSHIGPFVIKIDTDLSDKIVSVKKGKYSLTEILDNIASSLAYKSVFWTWLNNNQILIKSRDQLLYKKPVHTAFEILYTPVYNSSYFSFLRCSDKALLNYVKVKEDIETHGMGAFIRKYINSQTDKLIVELENDIQIKPSGGCFMLPHFFKGLLDLGEIFLKTLWLNQLKSKIYIAQNGQIRMLILKRKFNYSYSAPSLVALSNFIHVLDRRLLDDLIGNAKKLDYVLDTISMSMPTLRFISSSIEGNKLINLSLPANANISLVELLDLIAYQVSSNWEFMNENTIVFFQEQV